MKTVRLLYYALVETRMHSRPFPLYRVVNAPIANISVADFLAITVATDETDGFKRYARSAKQNNIPVKVGRAGVLMPCDSGQRHPHRTPSPTSVL